jgi:hypothetical protein
LATHLRETASETTASIVGRMKARDEEWLQKNGGHTRGIEKAVRAILEHTCCVIEGLEDQQLHPDVIAHSRALARAGFETHTLLERYTEGKTVFKEDLRQANAAVKGRSQAGYIEAEQSIESAFERLLRTVRKEHRAECERLKRSSAIRLREEVRQVLSGELNYLPEGLGYDSSATHIGVVGSGPGVEGEIRRLAKMLGGQPLIVQDAPNQFWAWVGLKQESSTAGVKNVLKAALDPTVCIAIGDPVPDLAGWRRAHQEANAAFPVAIHRPGSVVRYADVSVLASILGNPLLQQSLRTQFLDPLACERDGGRQLLATLRAYFAHDRNGRATAAALGSASQTVTNRLQRVEQCLGRSIAACGIGLEAAVLLADLTS